MGDLVSQTWVHPIKPHGGKRRKARKDAPHAQRPIIGGNGILEWDDASSALHYGTVNVCIPAAEAALELLLPPNHPARRYQTRLAPHGRVFTYQAGKWYVTKKAGELFPSLIKYSSKNKIDSYDATTGKAHTCNYHFDTGNLYFWGLCIIFGRFSGFEQAYPTVRALLTCGHLSFAFGPYGQLAHGVAQGDAATDEPRLCVLLHVHGEMTSMPGPKQLRYDMTGVRFCKAEQPFDLGSAMGSNKIEGYMCDTPMGFEQNKSRKSQARNEMEMLLRRMPRAHNEEYEAPSAAELRECFVDLCMRGMTAQTAPLLGDVVLLTAMTEDFRKEGKTEAEVRTKLVEKLEERLRMRGYTAADASSPTQWQEHAYHFPV